MSELDDELARGERLADELVDGAAETTIPVCAVNARGRLCRWEVSVALKGVIDPSADPEVIAELHH